MPMTAPVKLRIGDKSLDTLMIISQISGIIIGIGLWWMIIVIIWAAIGDK